jgi:hypothetical protein
MAEVPLSSFGLANCATKRHKKHKELISYFDSSVAFAGKMASGQKERALTSPKTSALAFISVLPWRINDGLILAAYHP